MLTDKLIPRLQQRFPNRSLRVGVPPGAVAIFPAAHPDVGDIEIFDDGDELTLVAGKFTHGHFSNFNSKSADQAEEDIVESVIDFLELLFADQIVLWGAHRGSGGWYTVIKDDPNLQAGHCMFGLVHLPTNDHQRQQRCRST